MYLFFKKKTLMVLGLVFILVVVGYFNYQLFFDTAAVDDNYDQAPINAELVDEEAENDIMTGSANITKEFFIEYKIERDKNRSEHVTMLENIADNPDSDEETKNMAQKEIINLVQLSEKEMIIENLIRAKGFNDAIVFIHDGYVNVIVDANQLTASQAVQIQDVVNKESGVDLHKISIAASNTAN